MAGDSEIVEKWPLERLKPHPENEAIFDHPEESEETFATLLGSIKKHGLWEPLLVKQDGTILAGHMRRACAAKLGIADVPVRVWEPASYYDEVTLLIRSNTDRRQLSKREIGLAFKRLKEIPREQGGAKRKRGRPSNDGKGAAPDTFSKTRDDAAEMIGVGREQAAACEVVFTTPGVPEPLKTAVNEGRFPPTTAAKAIRAEAAKQGGEIKSAAPLFALLEPKPPPDGRSESEKAIDAVAQRYRDNYARLVRAGKEIEMALTAMPLAAVRGATEQQEYRRELQMQHERLAMELEGRGRQSAGFTVIDGGKE